MNAFAPLPGSPAHPNPSVKTKPLETYSEFVNRRQVELEREFWIKTAAYVKKVTAGRKGKAEKCSTEEWDKMMRGAMREFYRDLY